MSALWPFPAPADDGAATHLIAGLALPDIALASSSGGTTSLARLSGRWIVFVYPWTGQPGRSNPPDWDDIPGAHGSTPQAQGFADLYEAYQAKGVGVAGLSGQPSAEQQEFAARLKLPFALLSDHAGAFRDALRLPAFETGGVRYLKRLTLVVQDGAIERAVYPVHPPDTHARDLLASLQAR
jgi:peroxiredoxin